MHGRTDVVPVLASNIVIREICGLHPLNKRCSSVTLSFFISPQANCLADPFFPCPLCGQAVGSDITPVESTVALEVT